MYAILNLADFIRESENLPLIDVRSPAEFKSGHVPHAVNVPLLNDEERVIVGTLYRQESSQSAIDAGLVIVREKLDALLNQVRAAAPGKNLLLYCMRGGMRSRSLALLLSSFDYQVRVLEGGYKKYRSGVNSTFEKDMKLIVLGGMTGSGKTDMLKHLQEKKVQVIDLEALANHKGSVFGGMGQGEQPSSEHFANLLEQVLRTMDFDKPIVLEDESAEIGRVHLPMTIYRKIREAPLLVMNRTREERIARLLHDYANYRTEIRSALVKLEKRLGGKNLSTALLALENGDMHTVTEIALEYYDRTYREGMGRRDPTRVIHLKALPAETDKGTAEVCRAIGNIEQEYYLKTF